MDPSYSSDNSQDYSSFKESSDFFNDLIPYKLKINTCINRQESLEESTDEIIKKYSPEIISINQSKYPLVNSKINISTTIADRFGKIDDAILSYSTDEGDSWYNSTMELIWGTPSNGTFLGTIPEQPESTIVDYKLYFKDDLNYSYQCEEDGLLLTNDIDPPEIAPHYVNIIYIQEGVTTYISATITDELSGIKNATLHYSKAQTSESIPLELVSGNKRDGKYVSMFPLPKFPVNTKVQWYLETYDNAGNNATTIPDPYSIIEPEEPINNFITDIRILEVDHKNLTSLIEFSVKADPFNEDLIYSLSKEGQSFSNIKNNYIGNLEGANTEDSDFKKFYNIFNTKFNIHQDDSYYTSPGDYSDNLVSIDNNIANSKIPLYLSGNPSKFPFDDYRLNILLAIPVVNSSVLLDNKSDYFGPDVLAQWNQPSLSTSLIKNDIVFNEKLNVACREISGNSITMCPLDFFNNYPHQRNDTTFQYIQIHFDRNYTIAGIIIPIMAIFYLLGAIFILENSGDHLGNRLALTLGIFALIFTLPEIINSVKPPTSGPTIADSMLSVIIITTIAFTISSIISSSSPIQKWFPKHHTWIDGIVFVIVSIFVIIYFSKYLLDSQLWWLVPILLFGLGYGLLLRTLGIKIHKPFIDFSRITKKKNV